MDIVPDSERLLIDAPKSGSPLFTNANCGRSKAD
jgi:hypothetical protein